MSPSTLLWQLVLGCREQKKGEEKRTNDARENENWLEVGSDPVDQTVKLSQSHSTVQGLNFRGIIYEHIKNIKKNYVHVLEGKKLRPLPKQLLNLPP